VPILDKMMANPLALITGFGWDTYDVMGFFYATHNHYLTLWFELGIVGLGSYLLLIGQLVMTARRAAEIAPEPTARYLIAFIYGILAVSGAAFFTTLSKPWLYVWMYVGLTMRMAVLTMQSPNPTSTAVRRRSAQVSQLDAASRGNARFGAAAENHLP
jgi:O-antigen ligase